MRRFYVDVLVDRHNKNFYKECSCCKERTYADKLPFLCRGTRVIEKVEMHKGSIFQQKLYNRKKALAVQHLARHFNQCTSCGRWVCNTCYHSEIEDGMCSICFQEENNNLR